MSTIDTPMITKQSFLAGLVKTTRLNAEYEFIRQCAKEGGFSTLMYLYECLNGDNLPAGIPDWARRGAAEHIVDSLALTPGLAQANAALALVAFSPTLSNDNLPWQQPVAALASKLVAKQSPEVVAAILHNLRPKTDQQEMAALILYEGVLRKKIAARSKSIQELHDDLSQAGHSLAWLPLELHEIERHITLMTYHFGGASVELPLPFGPDTRASATPIPTSSLNLALHETTTEKEARLISSAVDRWTRFSNGQIEAGVFAAERILPPDNSFLLSLKLKSLAPESSHLVSAHLSAAEAFSILFAAAEAGGAYPSGYHGAYGRLFAWQSVTGLVGADEEDSFADVSALAESCDWSFYEASNDWFYQVAWDIGLVCVRPGRKQVALLAATDTD